MPHRCQADNSVKSKLSQNDSDEKGSYVYGEDGFFGDFLIRVEDCWDEDSKHQNGSKLGAEIIGVFGIIVAIKEGPEKGRSDSDLDMLPGGFIYCSKKTDRAMLAGKIVKKMSQCAGCRNDYNTKPHDKSIVHKDIIA